MNNRKRGRSKKSKATKEQMKEQMKAEVAAWAERIKVQPKEVHIRPMARKWGSCSTLGRVTFDLGLLTEPAEFRKEIIVHELLHLKVPNHGKLFRALLKAYLGNGDVAIRSKK